MGTNDWGDEGSDVWSDSNGDTPEDEVVVSAALESLNEQIRAEIARLGGHVFPKLNWSAPRDAMWMNGSLKCSSEADVYLLLKSSDFVAHDLARMCKCRGVKCAEDCPDGTFTLILRKWSNLHPSNEFRCFVANRQLLGICQRNCTAYFPHLPQQQEHMGRIIAAFFLDVISPPQNKNSSANTNEGPGFPLDDFVFDVYIDKNERAW